MKFEQFTKILKIKFNKINWRRNYEKVQIT